MKFDDPRTPFIPNLTKSLPGVSEIMTGNTFLDFDDSTTVTIKWKNGDATYKFKSQPRLVPELLRLLELYLPTDPEPNGSPQSPL